MSEPEKGDGLRGIIGRTPTPAQAVLGQCAEQLRALGLRVVGVQAVVWPGEPDPPGSAVTIDLKFEDEPK